MTIAQYHRHIINLLNTIEKPVEQINTDSPVIFGKYFPEILTKKMRSCDKNFGQLHLPCKLVRYDRFDFRQMYQYMIVCKQQKNYIGDHCNEKI